MRFATEPDRAANIEDTLLAASIEGMSRDDLRLLSVLVTCIGVHSKRLNVDRLVRLVRAGTSPRVTVFWSAIAKWKAMDHRFARLAPKSAGLRLDLLRSGTEFQIRRHGEDERFSCSMLRVPAHVVRDPIEDVLAPAEAGALARRISMARDHRTNVPRRL
jgi:hypothetical protein